MRKPYVVIVSEVTIDGKLTLDEGVSSKEIMKLMDEDANRYLHQVRAECDGIMVGSTTVRIDNPSLTVRYVEGESPTRVIPASTGNLPLDANIFDVSKAPTVIAVTKRCSNEKIKAMEDKGVEVVIAGDDKVDFVELLERLYDMGITKLMVEGGSKVNWEMIRNDLVDEIRLIHLPVVIGGDNVPSLVSGDGFKTLQNVKKYDIKKVFQCGNQIITEYTRKD